MKLERVEIWDGLECDSGGHQATIAKDELLGAQLEENVNGASALTVSFDRGSVAWTDIQVERVLRAVYDDLTVQEFRITKPDEERTVQGVEQAVVRGRGVLYDLRHGLVNRVEADGTVTIFYTLLGQTRAALVAHILADARAYFTSGTITDSTTVVDAFTFNLDNPLGALQELAQLEGLELAVRRNGSTDFYVDLITTVGSAATVPEFRYRKNLLGVKRSLDSSKMANRIYLAGGGDDAVRLGLGQAFFKVATVVSATVIEPEEEIIFTDDHLDNLYLERPDLSRVQIVSTVESTQRIETTAAHNLSVGDRFQLRTDASGTWLTYVEDPDSQATYGILTDTVEQGDIPPVSNLLANPKLVSWTGDLPANWTKVGAPTTAEETDEEFTKVGGASAKVTAAAVGLGIQADAVTIAPVDPAKFYSFHIDVYVVSGKVELYAQHTVDGRFPAEGEGADDKKVAYSSKTGEWQTLKVEGKEWPAGDVQLRVVAKDGAATFYLDAAQLTRTSKAYPFLEGDGGAKLWARGLKELTARSLPVVTYTVNVLDLTAVDAARWPYDDVTLGGTVLVYDEELTLNASTRVLQLSRDLLNAHNIRMALSSKPEDLIDRLTLTARRTRQLEGARPSLALLNQFRVSVSQDGTIILQVFGAGATSSFRYIVDIETMATYAEVVDSGGDGLGSDLVDGSEVTVTAIRNAGAQTKLGRNQRAFVRVVAFPALGGNGTAGATDQALTDGPTFWSAEITSNNAIESGSSPNVTVRRTMVADNRTSSIRVYRRKDNWPTMDDTQDGQLDPQYDRGAVTSAESWIYEDTGWDTGDDVYDILVAVDANGQEGEREEPSAYTVTGTPSDQFTSTQRSDVDDGVSCGSPRSVLLEWTTSASVGDGTHDVRIYRIVDDGPTLLISTETSPKSNQSYQDDALPMYTGGSEARTVDYLLVLFSTGTDDESFLQETRGGRIWNLCTTPE